MVQPVDGQVQWGSGGRIQVEQTLHQGKILPVRPRVDPEDAAVAAPEAGYPQVGDVVVFHQLRVHGKQQEFQEPGRPEHVLAVGGNLFGVEFAIGVGDQPGDDLAVLVGADLGDRLALVE